MAKLAQSSFSDYDLEQKSIERRKKLMEALQAQAMQPMPSGQMVGNIYVRSSPLQGLAKLAQALVASKGMSKSEEDEKALGQRYSTDRANIISQALLAREGTPERTRPFDPQELEQSEDQGFQLPPSTIPAQPGSQEAMYRTLATSLHPDLQTVGLTGLTKKQESLFSKVDPKDYTPESVAQYAKTSDPAVLVPVRKMELGNFGGASGFYDPYRAQPGQVIPPTMGPGEQARLAEQQRQWANPSAYQQEQLNLGRGNLAVSQGNLGVARGQLGVAQGQLGVARQGLGLRAADTYFNTGMAPLGVPGM